MNTPSRCIYPTLPKWWRSKWIWIYARGVLLSNSTAAATRISSPLCLFWWVRSIPNRRRSTAACCPRIWWTPPICLWYLPTFATGAIASAIPTMTALRSDSQVHREAGQAGHGHHWVAQSALLHRVLAQVQQYDMRTPSHRSNARRREGTAGSGLRQDEFQVPQVRPEQPVSGHWGLQRQLRLRIARLRDVKALKYFSHSTATNSCYLSVTFLYLLASNWKFNNKSKIPNQFQFSRHCFINYNKIQLTIKIARRNKAHFDNLALIISIDLVNLRGIE